MTAPDKRARQKQRRDEMRAAQQAALRRRRNLRLLGVLGLLAIIAVGAMFFSGGEDTPDNAGTDPGGAAAEQPDPTAACGAEPPPPADPTTNYEEPGQVLEDGVDYSAVIQTSCGRLVIDLLEAKARIAVNNFLFLAGEGYYDGLIWHRVEQNSVIQTGDPNGQNGVPPDGPGYTIKGEPPQRSSQYVYGVVGMANTGDPDTAGGQFFIVIQKRRPAGYQPFYTIFGEVTDGPTEATEEEIGCNPEGPGLIPTLEAIGCQPTNTGAADPAEAVKPIVPVFIESIEIVEA